MDNNFIIDKEKLNNANEITTYEIMPEGYNHYDLSFKIIVVGDSGVGKSCLTSKGIKGIYLNDSQPTIGFDFFNFLLKINESFVKLQIWDTCGQESYKSVVANFYRNSSLAIMVYSIDNRNSFENVDTWLKELRSNSNPDVKVFLIGNKKDLENENKRIITVEEAMKFKIENKIDLFMESSAKMGDNSQNIFIEAAKILFQDYSMYSIKTKSFGGLSSRKNSHRENNTASKEYLATQPYQYDVNDRLKNKKSFGLIDKRENGSSSCLKC